MFTFKEEMGFHEIIDNAHCHPPSLERLNLRYKHFIQPAEHLFENSSVLDLGCHNGKFCYAAHQLNSSNIVGVDSEEKYIEIARQKVPFDNCKFIASDVEEFVSNLEQTFDIVMCLGVLYYIDPLPFLKNISKICFR